MFTTYKLFPLYFSKLQKVPSSGDDTKPGVRQSGSLEPSPSSPRRGQGRRSNRHRSAGSTFQRPGSPLAHILDTTTQPSLTTQRSRRFNDLWVRMDTYGKKFIRMDSNSVKENQAPQQAFQTWYQKSHGPDHLVSSGSRIFISSSVKLILTSLVIIQNLGVFQLVFGISFLTGIT
ncbi:uncharacterized protein TNIN_479471 [Trichonephila inaurata madagascariensis]|uniref:Uncharacterized protein n=1 Tax=Trichonephila inaurata madagascariensis TaxID=2747483 RepID=A0A8X7CHA1_9ARAC|nr:uncharacterized protein TNIN_479471 [Trichonephila inaurata madagascariensis]